MTPARPRWKLCAELALPLTLLAWRAAVLPLSALWRDAALILALYWIFTILASRSRAWLPVTVAVMGALFALYARHQIPFALDSLRLAF